MDDSEAYEAICTAAASICMAPPEPPLSINGKSVPRYHDRLNDAPGKRNGWYVAYRNVDGTIGGTVGSHKLQNSCNFCTSSKRTFTPEEKAEYHRQQAAARAKQEQERQQRHAEARTKADRIWRRSKPASPDHQYLVNKGIEPHRARQSGNFLVLDYRSAEGVLTTIQFVSETGEKRFLTGGEVVGSSHRFGGHPVHQHLILAEGFSTGATLFEATGYPVAIAGSAGNLLPVAVGFRAKYPGATIVIAADNDPVGIRSAQAAAAAVNGTVVLPDFSGEVTNV